MKLFLLFVPSFLVGSLLAFAIALTGHDDSVQQTASWDWPTSLAMAGLLALFWVVGFISHKYLDREPA